MAGVMPTKHALWLFVWLVSFQTILVSGQWGPVSQVNGVDTYQATPVQVRLQTCDPHVLWLMKSDSKVPRESQRLFTTVQRCQPSARMLIEGIL